MSLMRRAVGSASRRLDRPELLAAFYPGSRQAFREEIAIHAILASTLRSDATYVDIGTNRGQVLRQAVAVAPQGNHIAFEPIPALAAEVARDFPAVTCRQKALAARAGSAEFCYFRRLDGWSGLRRSAEISDERGDPEYITVEVSTLDGEIGDLVPRVVKIDVEGAEVEVLEGARGVLSEIRPVVLFEHVGSAAALYDSPLEAPWDLLTELGYRIFPVTGEGAFTRAQFAANTTVVNWLAVPDAPRTG